MKSFHFLSFFVQIECILKCFLNYIEFTDEPVIDSVVEVKEKPKTPKASDGGAEVDEFANFEFKRKEIAGSESNSETSVAASASSPSQSGDKSTASASSSSGPSTPQPKASLLSRKSGIFSVMRKATS